jgi:hypothetical protein
MPTAMCVEKNAQQNTTTMLKEKKRRKQADYLKGQ